MAISRKTQIALLFGASALLAGALVLWTMPKPEFMRMSESAKDVGKNVDEMAKAVMPSDDSSKSSDKTDVSPQPITETVGTAQSEKIGNYRAPKEKKSSAVSEIPAFDIVRIDPAGDSVIAGRVTPGKALELLLNGKVHDRLEPRTTGTFALTPPTLPPGDHQLTLREIGPDGVSKLSRQAVTVLLAPDLVSPPVIALTEPDKPTIVLAGPGLVTRQPGDDELLEEDAESVAMDANATAELKADSGPVEQSKVVSITTVEAEAGRLFVSGSALKDASVRLYLNDTFLAAGQASAKGAFAFTIDSGITDGDYRVRVDEVSPKDGKVISRAEVPFVVKNTSSPASVEEQVAVSSKSNETSPSQDTSNVIVTEVRTTRVEHGDSLWQISRRAYGEGTRYTVIYGANQEQIRNPNLIYPGQIFVLPNNEDVSAPP